MFSKRYKKAINDTPTKKETYDIQLRLYRSKIDENFSDEKLEELSVIEAYLNTKNVRNTF